MDDSTFAPVGSAHGAAINKLSVLMPIFNERWTLRTIIARVLASPVPVAIEVVAVDDCSTDGSWELLQELAASDSRIRPIRQPRNGGKGTAVRTAIEQMSGEVAVVQDADLEYDPGDFPRLLAPILANQADAVFGSRYAGATRRVRFVWHTLMNRGLTLFSNLLTGLDLSDMETCYKMVRADVLRSLRLSSQTFTLEPEITSRLAQWGARIIEVPVSYEGRSFREGKKIRPVDGIKAIGEMLRCRFVDRRYTHDLALSQHQAVDRARAWQRRLLNQIGDYFGDRVLDAKAGIGSLGWYFHDCQHAVLAEDHPLYSAILTHRFAPRENRVIERASLANAHDCRRWRAERLDTVLLSDLGATAPATFETLTAAADILTPLGHLVWVLPAEATHVAGSAVQSNSLFAASDYLKRAGLQVVLSKTLGRGLRGPATVVIAVGRKPAAAQQRTAA